MSEDIQDILEEVRKLKEIGTLAHISSREVPEGVTLNPETLLHLHIECQTYLLAEILQELRKANNQ